MAKHEVTYGPIDPAYKEWEAQRDIPPIETQIVVEGKPRTYKVLEIQNKAGETIEVYQDRATMVVACFNPISGESVFIPYKELIGNKNIDPNDLPVISNMLVEYLGETNADNTGLVSDLDSTKKRKTTRPYFED